MDKIAVRENISQWINNGKLYRQVNELRNHRSFGYIHRYKKSLGDDLGGVWFIYDTPDTIKKATDNIIKMEDVMWKYAEYSASEIGNNIEG